MNSQDISIIVDKLSQKINSGTTSIYNITLEGIRAYVAVDILYIFISILCMWIGFKIQSKFYDKNSTITSYDVKFLFHILSILFPLLGFVIFIEKLSELFYCLFSPHYWAMHDIISTVKDLRG